MRRLFSPGRLVFLTFVVVSLTLFYFVSLYKLQIVDGDKYYQESINSKTSKITVPAARGSILDRYGRLLVENRPCNNLMINVDSLFDKDNDPDYTIANAAILELCNTVTEFGDAYTDTLPITKAPPFEYTPMTDVQRVFLQAYLSDHRLAENTTAVQLLA